MSFYNEKISERVQYGSYKDKRYKTNRISVNFVVNAKKEKTTINALIPRLLKKGYHGLKNNTEFYRELQNLYGAVLSANVSIKGDYQIVTVAITSLDSKYTLQNENMPKLSAEILNKVIFTPMADENGFYNDIVEAEKKALKDAIIGEINDKRAYAINQATSLTFDGEGAGLPRCGFLEDVDVINAQNAYQAYQELLLDSDIYIMFTGCGDDSDVKHILGGNFDRFSSASDIEALFSPHHNSELKEKTETIAVEQAKMVMCYSTKIMEFDENIIAAARVMSALLGGTPSSMLFENVREKLSLCYYCASRMNTFKSLIIIDCGVENANIQKAISAISAQIDKLKSGDFGDDKIHATLLALKNFYRSIYENDTAIEGFYLGRMLMGRVISPEEEMSYLEAVTKKNIVDIANTLSLETVYVLKGNGDEKNA